MFTIQVKILHCGQIAANLLPTHEQQDIGNVMPVCISTGIQVTCVIISVSQHSHTNTDYNSIIKAR